MSSPLSLTASPLKPGSASVAWSRFEASTAPPAKSNKAHPAATRTASFSLKWPEDNPTDRRAFGLSLGTDQRNAEVFSRLNALLTEFHTGTLGDFEKNARKNLLALLALQRERIAESLFSFWLRPDKCEDGVCRITVDPALFSVVTGIPKRSVARIFLLGGFVFNYCEKHAPVLSGKLVFSDAENPKQTPTPERPPSQTLDAWVQRSPGKLPPPPESASSGHWGKAQPSATAAKAKKTAEPPTRPGKDEYSSDETLPDEGTQPPSFSQSTRSLVSSGGARPVLRAKDDTVVKTGGVSPDLARSSDALSSTLGASSKWPAGPPGSGTKVPPPPPSSRPGEADVVGKPPQ